MSPDETVTREARLTKRERAALDLFRTEGDLNEGMMENLWPLIRSPRLVTNSLVRKGLVTLGGWAGRNARYELHLTDAGRAALASSEDRGEGAR